MPKMEGQAPEIGRLALRKIGQRLQGELTGNPAGKLPSEIERQLAKLAELDTDRTSPPSRLLHHQ